MLCSCGCVSFFVVRMDLFCGLWPRGVLSCVFVVMNCGGPVVARFVVRILHVVLASLVDRVWLFVCF